MSPWLMSAWLMVQSPVDTIKTFDEVVVESYHARQKLLQVAAPISVLSPKFVALYDQNSPLSLLNSVPGVRMEERSPGSFRLSIRGSSVRSPFGVRNVKVYWEGIPITDAAGNTFLNLLDFAHVGSVELLRGPAGSVYGAGTGGVVLLSGRSGNQGNTLQTQLTTGSWGSIHLTQRLSVASTKLNAQLQLSGWHSDGYRDHTQAQRQSAHFQSTFFISPKRQVHVQTLWGGIDYQTPGGLTQAQVDQNRRQSRPATPTLPSAIQQKAGISQQQLLVGISQKYQFNAHWQNETSLFTSQHRLRNPFITNFEIRDEQSIGSRSVWYWDPSPRWSFRFGGEWQQTYSTFDVYDNNRGVIGNRQVEDEVLSTNALLFAQADWSFLPQWKLTFGLGVHQQSFDFFRRQGPGANQIQDRPQTPSTPRVALLRELGRNQSLYASWSQGFSAPTVQEFVSVLRPNQLFSPLRSEQGISQEMGYRGQYKSLSWDIQGYQFRLTDVLVRQVDPAGQELFVNAGKAVQRGVEGQLKLSPRSRPGTFAQLNYQGIRYTYEVYQLGSNDWAGNRLPSVPARVATYLGNHQTRWGGFLWTQAQWVARTPLNDANTVWAEDFIQVQARLGWKWERPSFQAQLFVGGDNLLNQTYSLGNDANAIGNRFFNPAAPRTWQLGSSLRWNW